MTDSSKTLPLADSLPESPDPPGIVHPIRYRADIDGLRAVSVLSVIAFHVAPSRFVAGGIGVDIFFVISGYLIGGIVLASLDTGRLSFRDFYLRRVRRIIPAFAVMVLAALAGALLLFFPKELVKAADSGIMAILSVSNIFFYATTSYFSPNTDALLLHTWTLGVEEQFYFVFPPLALAGSRLFGRRAVMPLLVALAAASLALSEWQVWHARDAAFYLLPARAWELLFGVIASRLSVGRLDTRFPREVAALVGLALIVASLALLRPAERFPGIVALPPCLGAALLLVAGQHGRTFVGRALSITPLRLVGLASYSLYLWHWPIIILIEHLAVVPKLSPGLALVAVALTLAAGFLSWRFVEAPFRARAMGTRRLLTICAALAAAGLALCGAIVLAAGFPQRIPAHARALAALEYDERHFASPQAHCFLGSTEPLDRYDRARCLAPDPVRRDWLLVGDSHAAMLWGALAAAYPRVRFLPAIAYGGDLRLAAPADGGGADPFWHMIFTDYLPRANIDGVILSSLWLTIEPDRLRALATDLRRRRIALMIVGPTPEFGVAVPRLLAEAERRRDPALLRSRLIPRVRPTDAALRRLAAEIGAIYVSPLDAMCAPDDACLLTDARGLPIYSDDDHYTGQGAGLLLGRLRASDDRAGAPLARAFGTAAGR